MNIRNLTGIKTLLLENKTIKQTIFKNTFWLTIGTGVGKVFTIALIIYVARILGATEYGKFTFALAFISLFAVIHKFGLSPIIIREFAREEDRRKEFYSVISLKILLSIGTLVLILVSSLFISPDPDIRKIILILALFSLIDSFTTIFYAFFQARQRMEYRALAEIFQAIVMTSIGFFILFRFPSVENISYGYLFAALFGLIFVLIFFHLKVFYLKISWQKSIWQKFLFMSWPLALTSLFGALYTYIDSVMMGYLGMITEVGWYNAAYRIIIAVLIPIGLISGSFYPVLSNLLEQSKEKIQNVWNYQMELMTLLGLPLVIGGIALAPQIIYFIYSTNFEASILAFQILLIMAGFIFLYRPLYDIMLVFNQQKKMFWITLGGALLNIILNLILIPRYSLYGAAVATVITHSAILLIYLRYTTKLTSIYPFNLKFLFTFITASIASMVMYVTVTQSIIYNLHIFFSILTGALIYIISIFVLKEIGKPIYKRVV